MIKQLLMGVIGQQDILNYYNANIIYKELPIEVNGYVFYYRNINCIIINKNLSYYRKKKTILHELAHIEKNHLCQADKDLLEFHRSDYEDEADRYLKKIMEEIKNEN
ncbi:MAG: ImmA/IrrE family metallo-endopeptidase [Ruminococcus sp.]|nr:ImmA/IrrE family metallo-endopeptidase [Ruminococcus sp.]